MIGDSNDIKVKSVTNKGNPMLGARIPPEWMKEFQELASERGCKVAELAREALGQYLGKKGDITDSTEINLNSNLKDRLESIEARIGDSRDFKLISQKLELLQNQVQELKNEVTVLTGKEKSSTTEKKAVKITESWLTTGEAYDEAKRRGLTQSLGTFRRWLREASEKEQLPTPLESLNLEANWIIRKKGNPKDNSLRWLRFQ